MPFIIGVNPVNRKKKTKNKKTKTTKKVVRKPTRQTQRKGTVMAKRRKKSTAKKVPTVRYRTRTKTITKYRKRGTSKAAHRVSRKTSTSDALNLAKIFRGAGAVSIGMIIAKVAVNKLTEGGSEKMGWTWPNIFMAAGASIVGAFVLGAFGIKKPTVAMVAIGGVGLSVYKIFTCKVAPKWGWTESWFGADEDTMIHPDFLGEGEIDVVDYEPADMGYIPGVGGTGGGGMLVDYNPNMGATNAGGQMVDYNPNMGALNPYQQMGRRSRGYYRNAYAGAF
jgi:hypothetical protein